jgi:hypothetical protein
VIAFHIFTILKVSEMGNMWEMPLSSLVRNYDPDAHPICGPLLEGGPAQLAREYGVKHEDEYVDACHMCSNPSLLLQKP